MKKITFLFVSAFFITCSIYSQVKEKEITSKNSKGKAELINFSETKINSDDKSVNTFLKKQYNSKNDEDFISDSKNNKTENKLESKKYQQFYKGLKVEFGVQNVVSENGILKTTNGRYIDISEINIIAKLSEKEALDFALKNIGAKSYMWENKNNEDFLKKEQNDSKATYFPKGELLVIEKDIFGENPTPVLAYKFDIYASNPISRDYVYVDANNGTIILKDAIIKHIQGTGSTRYSGQRTFETQQSGTQYKLRDYSRGSGIETYNMNKGTDYNSATDFIDNDNNWTSSEFNNINKDNAALDAHWGAEKTYDYFFIKHNRNSYNNSGAVLKNYVHANLIAMGYPSNDNAFWDGQRMTYGDGTSSFDALTSVDVVGHEIGHGVCSYTANLIYSKESGAINEGLSDIWGAMIEYYADPTKQTYLIGEEIKLGGGALRSMSNPNVYNQPKTYGGTYWYDQNCTPNNLNDYCGVHRNSGVMNHWFYILSEGKTDTNDIGNAYNVTGIGKDKAAKIVYRAESVYFTSTTNYSQARDWTIQAAKDLYGANSVEAATTCQSWYAVGVGNNNCVVVVDISGDKVLCNSSTNSTYTASNLLPGSVINWSISTNALLLVSSNNTSITVKPINATYNGIATITATVSGKTTTKTIWIGKPSITTELVSDSNYVDIYLIGEDNTDTNEQGITSTTWLKTASTDGGTAGGSGFRGHGSGPNFYWTATLNISATNICGTTQIVRTVTCAPPVPCNDISYQITQTDGSNFVITQIIIPCQGMTGTETTTIYKNKIDAYVYDYQGNEVLKTNSNNIDTSKLKKGIYIIKVLVDNQIISKKIIK